ncbi:MAG: hypothetical protein HC888_00645 [Candidatus Competibacteraceae bacterium]|nr:hypothetical protein [Candidatus Competibacteraceae bacterium]
MAKITISGVEYSIYNKPFVQRPLSVKAERCFLDIKNGLAKSSVMLLHDNPKTQDKHITIFFSCESCYLYGQLSMRNVGARSSSSLLLFTRQS